MGRDLPGALPEPGFEGASIEAFAAGGGDLNGSANTANLLGHAGTGADRPSVPRLYRVNYCGVV